MEIEITVNGVTKKLTINDSMFVSDTVFVKLLIKRDKNKVSSIEAVVD